MPTVTKIEPQKRRKGRSNVFVDGAFAFGLSDGVVLKYGLRAGDELPAARRAEIEQGELKAACFTKATMLLGRRPHGEAELRRKLTRRDADWPPHVVDAVMDELKRLRYLDDAQFAAARAGDAVRGKAVGSRRALAELKRAGVNEKVAAAAVSAAYAERDEAAVARELVRKKLRGVARLDPATAKRRLYGMLARRGFGTDVINDALAAELSAPRDDVD